MNKKIKRGRRCETTTPLRLVPHIHPSQLLRALKQIQSFGGHDLDLLSLRLERCCPWEGFEPQIVAWSRGQWVVLGRYHVRFHELLHVLQSHVIRLQDDACAQLLVQEGVRDSHHQDITDTRTSSQTALHPFWVEDVRSSHDGVAASALYYQVATLVQSSVVAYAEEPAASEGT